MKVVHAFKVYLPHRGGIVATIQSLCEGLNTQISTAVLASFPRGLGRKELIHGVTVTRVTSLLELWAMPIAPTYPLHFWQASHHTDIVDYHFPFPLVDLAVSTYFPRHTGLVIHWHSEIVAQQRTGQLVSPFIRRCLARADRILISTPHHLNISPYLKEVADQCMVIPFGIDVRRWETRDAQDHDEIERIRMEFGDFFLSVGRLIPYKGMDVLIGALRDIPGSLVIVGDGPLKADLVALAQSLGVADRVHFTGDVSFRRLKALMHTCRFFVLPSAAPSETFGIVQLEAMACSKAIINTDIHPGIGWVARHEREAITVPALNSRALAGAICRLQENPQETVQLGQQGAVRVRQVFGLDRFLQDTLAVYHEVAAKRRRQ